MLNTDQLFQKLVAKRERGTEILLDPDYRGIWETAIKKYSDTAHFVYELLQNADDTKATQVEFILERDGLWFKHNGKIQFSVSDVDTSVEDTKAGKLGHLNAITAIGNSSKVDEQKIGKFGIGFKAVFAYSFTPHIYDDNFSFKLEDYIVPRKLNNNSIRRKAGETLFYFPFNHPEKPAEEAYEEIEEKLLNLFQPLLFLSNLQKIVWASDSETGRYTKKEVERIQFGRITARKIKVQSPQHTRETLWVFSTGVEFNGKTFAHDINVAFFVLPNGQLETGFEYEAFCFFTTQEATGLPFIIQAPFLLTDSRANINAGSDWNHELIDNLAELAADSLVLLKKIGIEAGKPLINDNLFDIIPYKPTGFNLYSSKSKISFGAFYSAILDKLQTEAILPGRDGRFYDKAHAYFASDPELADLLSDEQISHLMGNPDSGLIFTSRGWKQLNQADRDLEKYLEKVVAEKFDLPKILRKITPQFMTSQPDEWIIRFYKYLAGRSSVWSESKKLVQRLPILLNQNREAVVPFQQDLTTPTIFLPSDKPTSYDTIYLPLLEDEEAAKFIKDLGIGKPDVRAEIFNIIVPKYTLAKPLDDWDKDALLQHVETFLTYSDLCPQALAADYYSQLKKVKFLVTKSGSSTDRSALYSPDEVYHDTQNLNQYFGDSPAYRRVDTAFYAGLLEGPKRDKFLSFLSAVGVSGTPRITAVKWPVSEANRKHFGLDKLEVSQKYYWNQVILDKELPGLTELQKHITLERSKILWDFLLQILVQEEDDSDDSPFLGEYNYTPFYKSYNWTTSFESTLSSALKYDPWLYDKDGGLRAACHITRDELAGEYNLSHLWSTTLLHILGIQNPEANLNLTEEQEEIYLLGKKAKELGASMEDLAAFEEFMSDRKRSATGPVAAAPADLSDAEDAILIADDDIEATLSSIKKGIKKNRLAAATRQDASSEDASQLPAGESKEEDGDDSTADSDDYTKPPVNIQNKIDKLRLQAEAQIEDLTRIEKLNQAASEAEKYSFAWFKALLELEYLNSHEANATGKEISIQFSKVEKEPDTERTLILAHPNRYIPQSIEDIGDLVIRLYHGNETTSVTVEVVNVKEYTLRAKLKKSSDITGINLASVSRVVLDIKNPIFILEELRKSFNHLALQEDYNLKENLTENIRFIFGPPGTGKTTYLATNEIIPLMQGKDDLKVLVLTPTNKAADVLTTRIVEKMGDDASYHNWLFRHGTTGDPSIERSGLVVDKTFNIAAHPRNTTITTIARFAYDFFQPEQQQERLHLKHLHWDYIIIDEASMVNLASIAFILYQRPEAQFIVAGDPFQIEPITQVEQWKDHNIYTMVELDRFQNPTTSPHAYEVVTLTTQYRSLPTIGNVFSYFTYNGLVHSFRKPEEQKTLNVPGLTFKDINLIKFPVSPFQSIHKSTTLNKSHYHPYAAIFTVEFANRLSEIIAASHKDSFRIGIICPYKAQATVIEKLLARMHQSNDKTKIIVGTIHGFQGDECDVIIAVLNCPERISKSGRQFVNKQNILNVAISRARDYLFILMPTDITPDINNLHRVKRIERLIRKYAPDRYTETGSDEVEKVLFGSDTYIYDNSFATTHQSVNVYSKPEKKYEIRCEEVALDIQVKQ